MDRSENHPKLERLLNVCDELQLLQRKMTDPELAGDARSRLRRQSKKKSEQLARALGEYRLSGPLAEVIRSYRLAPEHFQVLAVLLHREMRSEDPALEGRMILSAIFESSYDVLTGMALLMEQSPLRSAGLIVPEEEEENPEDALGTRFRLSEEVLEAFRSEITGLRPTDLGNTSQGCYSHNRELLTDLRILHNLYRQRSERVFQQERWDRLHQQSETPGRNLSRRIEAYWLGIRQKLDNTQDATLLPAFRLMQEHNLQQQEIIMVVHLLFQELYEGNAYADVADMLKLVSASEDELMQNRRLVASNATLICREVLNIEAMLEGRVLTGEAHLADWVVNYVFGATSQSQHIQPDERIDWHLYLDNLSDTKGFYRDLEAN